MSGSAYMLFTVHFRISVWWQNQICSPMIPVQHNWGMVEARAKGFGLVRQKQLVLCNLTSL